MLTIENFYQFVRDQNPNDPINNDSWDTCAIGDYVRHDRPRVDSYMSSPGQFARDLPAALYGVVNDAKATDKIPLYGDLQAYIPES